MLFPGDRRFNSFVGYFKENYGRRLQKIVIDAGFSCPNRDGSVSVGGCTYCNNDAFHPSYSTPDKPIIQQIEEGVLFHRNRYRRAERYLAYFQPYSNTHATLDNLRQLYSEALSHPLIDGIVIGTRPDCVDDDKLDWLAALSRDYIVIVEYGIESIYDKTLERINRGHTFAQSREAIIKTAAKKIRQGAHFIFGLPGETILDMIGYADEINRLPIDSVKFHQLQIVTGTIIEKEFADNPSDFHAFELNEYIDFFVNFLELLRPDIYIERFAGEIPPRYVKCRPWGTLRNVELIRLLEKRLEERNTFQGKRFMQGS